MQRGSHHSGIGPRDHVGDPQRVVAPDGQDTMYSFEYGTTTTFGTSTPSQDAGAGTLPQLVQSVLTGLQPGTPYYFRLDTTTATTGTTHGATQTFTTAPNVTVVQHHHRHHVASAG